MSAPSVPGLPTLSPSASIEEIRTYLQKVQLWSYGREPNSVGAPLDKFVTRNDLVNAGIITFRVTGSPGGGVIGGGGGGSSDAPDVITGLAVTGLLTHFLVEFDAPTYSQGGGNGYTEIYAANYSGSGPLPTFADAVLVGTVTGAGTIFLAAAQPGQESHFWAGAVTVDGVRQVDGVGPTGGTNGVTATTGQDVSTLLDVLTAAALDPNSPYDVLALRADLFTIVPTADFYQSTTPTALHTGDTWYNPTSGLTYTWTGSAWAPLTISPPFFVSTVPVTNNGVTAPPGVYMTQAFILNGDITNAKIGNLAVDDAKVASMSVAKLIAGSLAVSEYIQSTGYNPGVAGYKIDGAGNAEFNNVTVRGTVYATSGSFTGTVTATSGSFTGSIFANSGTIAGATFTSSEVHSPGYSLGTTGWQLDSSSGRVNATSLHVLDSTGTRIFNTDATGVQKVLQIGTALSVDASGNAVFGGSLTANGIVNTAQLVANSVTQVATNVPVGTISVPTGSPTVVATLTITTSGEAVVIFANAFMTTAGGASTSSVGVYRDGVLLYTDSDNAAGGLKFVWSGIDIPAAGAHTYTVEATATTAGCNSSARSLGLMQAKR